MADSTPSSKLADFSDRLSPMLVKELRQGLRTHLFVTAFMLLQGFMFLCILMASADGSSVASGFFWFFIVVTFVVVQPLRGFGALSNEYTLNTMDLIQLTHMDALRITWGKWLALNAQTLLMMVAVLPYLVLRYFFGSVDLVSDLALLGLFTISSLFLSSMAIGCSAFRNLFVRCILLILFVVAYVLAWIYLQNMWSSSAAFGADEYIGIGLLIFTTLFITAFFIYFGASRIAPPSDNYSSLKRGFGLGLAALVYAAQWLLPDSAAECTAHFTIILGLVIIDALTEELPMASAMGVRNRHSPLRKLLAYLFTPGWATAALFALLIAAPLWSAGMLQQLKWKADTGDITVILGAIGMLILPLALILLFFRKARMQKFTLYLFIQLVLALVTLLIALAADESVLKEDMIYLCCPLPSVLTIASKTSSYPIPMLAIGAAWVAISFTIIIVAGLPYLRDLSKALRQA